MDALTEAAFANSQQSALYHLQELAIVVALAEEKLFGVGTGGAVGNILRGVFVGGAAVGLGAGNRTAQILLPGLKPFLESF
jgi:citrate lyase synthetase